jgi:hypothetical protein
VEHATEEVIARGGLVDTTEDEGEGVNDPTLLELFLDDDNQYRWYEDGAETEAFGPTIQTAMAAARQVWPGFALLEFRGETVMNPHQELPDAYAADELEEKADPDDTTAAL